MDIENKLFIASGVLEDEKGLILPCDAKSEGEVHLILNKMERKWNLRITSRLIGEVNTLTKLSDGR